MIKTNPYNTRHFIPKNTTQAKPKSVAFCGGINDTTKLIKSKKGKLSLAGLVCLVLLGIVHPQGPVKNHLSENKVAIIRRHKPIKLPDVLKFIKFKI